jgi:methylated-DNA-protein-cysteine methyltransferase-like protein
MHMDTDHSSLSQRIKDIIKEIPRGRVATYGQIATMAGSPRGARQVVRILHSSSRKEKLPWHRVISSKGRISLPPGFGYETQKSLLLEEGIVFDRNVTVDFERFLWSPKAAG